MLSNANRLKTLGTRLLLGKKMTKILKKKRKITQKKKGLLVQIGLRNGLATLKAIHVMRYWKFATMKRTVSSKL